MYVKETKVDNQYQRTDNDSCMSSFPCCPQYYAKKINLETEPAPGCDIEQAHG